MNCKCGCGKGVPESKGTKKRTFYDDSCRKRYKRTQETDKSGENRQNAKAKSPNSIRIRDASNISGYRTISAANPEPTAGTDKTHITPETDITPTQVEAQVSDSPADFVAGVLKAVAENTVDIRPKKKCTCYDDLPKDVREAIESLTAWCKVQKIADDHQARVDRAIYYQNEVQA